MPNPSQPLSAKKTRAAVKAQGDALGAHASAINAQADVISKIANEVDRQRGVIARLEDLHKRGFFGRLRWVLFGA